MKRSELQRKTPLLRKAWFRSRSPISRISPAKRRDIELGKAARAAVIDRDRHCVLCSEPISDVHHRLPRGAGGAAHDPTRWSLSRLIGLCRSHHRWTEENRTVAERDGLLVRHGVTEPAKVPVRYHGQWALLRDDGWVTPVAIDWRRGGGHG
jgi:5-methylcytosine-specific restriction endonuclease McrA